MYQNRFYFQHMKVSTCVIARSVEAAQMINDIYQILRVTTFLEIANTGLFISPSGISELDCATTKIDTAERSISIGRESLQVFFLIGALTYFQVPPLGGSRDEKWRSQ